MTPIRSMLVAPSSLAECVEDGLRAVKGPHRDYVANEIRSRFEDSIDIDSVFQGTHPSQNRWDYLLGDGQTSHVFGLEPHSAKSDQVSTVIAKKTQALLQLRGHLKPGRGVTRWFWVASGSVHFPSTDAVNLRLASHNIRFVGRELRKRDLK